MKKLFFVAAAAALACFLSTRKRRQLLPLADRVRADLRSAGWHPGWIGVSARRGVVTLRGALPQSEIDRALVVVLAVPGVTEVISYLKAPREPEALAELQVGMPRSPRAT